MPEDRTWEFDEIVDLIQEQMSESQISALVKVLNTITGEKK